MAFSRKALKASKAARRGETDMVAIMREGERAAIRGLGLDANPYPAGTEDNEIWAEAFTDQQENG